MPEPLLSISRLCVERGERLLFDQYSFSINPGEAVQVAGPNGSGKTSLMRVLAGLLSPQKAEIHWRGNPVSRAQVYSDELLYLGHKAAVRDQLSPLENLRWYAQLHCQQFVDMCEEQYREALDQVGLKNHESELCARLSAGQKRRVNIARLAIAKVPLWILDEPYAALDVKGIARVTRWMEAFVTGGGTLIYSTHQLAAFRNLRPRVLALA